MRSSRIRCHSEAICRNNPSGRYNGYRPLRRIGIFRAETLRLKLKNSFYKAYSLGGDHNHVYSKVPKKDSGFVVDYRVDGNYVKRVNFSIGLGGRLSNPNPAWGCNRVQDLHVDLRTFEQSERIFSLDLKKLRLKIGMARCFFCGQ